MLNVAEQIKDKLDIIEIIGSYIKVEKAGLSYKARCPFHNEKTPSFFISPQRQNFYCFGCHEKGDVITFVEKMEGLDFKGTVQILADKAGIELSNFPKFEKENSKENDRMYNIMAMAVDFFERELAASSEVQKYIESRGINKSSIKKWSLGYAPAEWRALCDHMTKEGINKEDLLKMGLIKKVEGEAHSNSSGQAKYYDTFRGRVMFPIFDINGKVIAFSGRIFVDDKKSPKYINSPETPLFYKSEVLYGLNFAKQVVRKLDYSVFVEGQMDLVMSHQVGIENTVATSGTALTELHLQKIKKLSNKILFAFDGDAAGRAASRKSAELAMAIGMEAKVANIPEGEDPASLAGKDGDKWKDCLRSSKHVIDFELERLTREGYRGERMIKAVIEEVLPLLALIRSELEKSYFVRLIAQKLGLPEASVLKDLSKIKSGEATIYKKTEDQKSAGPEKMLLAIYWWQTSLKEPNIDPQTIRKKMEEIFSPEKLLSLEEENMDKKEELVFEAERSTSNTDKLDKILNEIYERIEIKVLKERLENLVSQIDRLKEEEKEKVEKEITNISKRIKEIS